MAYELTLTKSFALANVYIKSITLANEVTMTATMLRLTKGSDTVFTLTIDGHETVRTLYVLDGRLYEDDLELEEARKAVRRMIADGWKVA